MILCSFIRKVFVIFRKILQEIVASGDLDVDGGLSWEEFEGFGNFEFVANWFGYEDKSDCPIQINDVQQIQYSDDEDDDEDDDIDEDEDDDNEGEGIDDDDEEIQ